MTASIRIRRILCTIGFHLWLYDHEMYAKKLDELHEKPGLMPIDYDELTYLGWVYCKHCGRTK